MSVLTRPRLARRHGGADGGRPARESAPGRSRLGEAAMRALDLLGATALLVLLAPLMLVVGVIVRIDSPGPAIYRQRRLGKDMEPFSVAKFRTMQRGAATDAHREHVLELIDGAARAAPMAKLRGDARLTRIGRFLRRTSIDELPQLWNVLKGEMSLVGPRPPIPYEVERYPARANRRFAVRPGITGLWQVRGRSLLSFEQMIELDLEYVERRSLWFNLWILLATLPAVLSGRGAG